MSFKDLSFIAAQYIVPQHLLSRLVGKVAASEISWVKNAIIKRFISTYNVDMTEAKIQEAEYFKSFNDFFTRELIDGARAICDDNDALACPADGAISQIGDIKGDQVFQAKGQYYSLSTLLGGDIDLAKDFQNGKFATVYLSPRDYHRVHMPYTGTLRKTIYVPGDLFSVNTTTAANVDNLFARNERLVCVFDTSFGPMVVILVGAMIVAGIETVWAGEIAPVRPRLKTEEFNRPLETITINKGEEIGRFKLGSTAIVLTPSGSSEWLEHFEAGSPTRMGETLGKRSA